MKQNLSVEKSNVRFYLAVLDRLSVVRGDAAGRMLRICAATPVILVQILGKHVFSRIAVDYLKANSKIEENIKKGRNKSYRLPVIGHRSSVISYALKLKSVKLHHLLLTELNYDGTEESGFFVGQGVVHVIDHDELVIARYLEGNPYDRDDCCLCPVYIPAKFVHLPTFPLFFIFMVITIFLLHSVTAEG